MWPFSESAKSGKVSKFGKHPCRCTNFIFCQGSVLFNSRIIKEVVASGGRVTGLVPEPVERSLAERLGAPAENSIADGGKSSQNDRSESGQGGVGKILRRLRSGDYWWRKI